MRVLITLLFVLVFSNLFASEPWKDWALMTYNINSDTLNTDVKKGKCRVCGIIYDQGKPSGNALVASANNKYRTRSNSKGEYCFQISSSDTSIYAFKSGNEEIIIHNYHFKSQHDVNIDFYINKRRPQQIHARKPVIYLYADSATKVNLKVIPSGDFTFTYPAHNDGWNVVVDQNELTHGGKPYPYLFWESINSNLDFVSSNDELNNAYLIKTDTSIKFLENQLELLGLNEKESTDFITYWGPIIQKEPYSLIQFEIDDNYDKVAELEITPKPDVQRRIFMYTSGLKNPIDIRCNPISISPFTRHGLTLIEWGGAVIQNKSSL